MLCRLVSGLHVRRRVCVCAQWEDTFGAYVLEKLTASFLLCRLVSGIRCSPACVSQLAGTGACKMARIAAFDIASLVLDGGAVVKSFVEAVVLAFNSV